MAGETKVLPPTLASAIALDAWNEIAPLQSQSCLGRLLAAELLRGRGKTRAHLGSLSLGLKAPPQQRRWKRDPATRLDVTIEALRDGAEAGLKEHYRLSSIRERLTRRAGDRRSNSSLPGLIELAIETPVVTAALIAARLTVTPRAALGLAQELGLRESTGRKRYRAWAAA